ncbi:MBL fold metallo-hydrolase [Chryseotalea sanaruensis]|uniref:MBL fold metallo-hydrolase n=1 Tax=Chryseotalea sanaruensis TaxID=2482724 RepID=A0A401U759_9BACT|nr:MBL fold metallo-hydrolase [Chryseotalea sanaruensis]GCC50719.1 MBL fold metallo-hydrolase [Chryseotalea sanaruensis]
MPNLQTPIMLTLQRFTFNDLAENTYILYDTNGLCFVIDPGCYSKNEQEELANFIQAKKLKVVQVLNTHCHIDHVLGNYFVTSTYKAPLFIPSGEEAVLKAVKAYAPNYGFQQYQEAEPAGFLAEATYLSLGEEVIQILSVPGHSPAHVAFYIAKQAILIGGDVLFRESIGRTDLPGGNFDTLIKSIHTKLFTLPNDVTVYPGHGPETTIGYEKVNNPFCAIAK